MSADYARIDKPRRSRHFWAPVWISLVIGGGIGVFYCGQFIKEYQQSGKDTLSVTAMRSPSEALEVAEGQLLRGSIDFAFYRDLLQAALSQSDYQLGKAAYQSIQRVLASGRPCAERLEKWLPSLPREVFITTADKGAAQDIEQKLNRADTDVFIKVGGAPFRRTQVSCYDQAVCKQTAALIALLRDEGYEVDEAKLSDGGAAFAHRIDIQLAEVKPAKQPRKTRIAKPRPRPKEAQPGLIARE